MLSSRRQGVEVLAGFGRPAMIFKRLVCMKRLVSSVWPSLKDGPRVTSMWFSAKHFQIRKADRPKSARGHLRTCPAQDRMSASPLKADIAATTRNVGYGPVAFTRPHAAGAAAAP